MVTATTVDSGNQYGSDIQLVAGFDRSAGTAMMVQK
jgi:hypothetical protein